MNKKIKKQQNTNTTQEKSLRPMLDILHRARVEAALDKIATLKEQLIYVFARAQHGELSLSTARTLSLDLEQELTRTICTLESWYFQMRGRV